MRFTRARYQQGGLIREVRKGRGGCLGRSLARTNARGPQGSGAEGRRYSSRRHQQRELDAVDSETASQSLQLRGNSPARRTLPRAESLRHSNSRITLDVYTQGLMPTKRLAQGRVVKSLLAPRGPMQGTSVVASA
jgi:hypothetical protein